MDAIIIKYCDEIQLIIVIRIDRNNRICVKKQFPNLNKIDYISKLFCRPNILSNQHIRHLSNAAKIKRINNFPVNTQTKSINHRRQKTASQIKSNKNCTIPETSRKQSTVNETHKSARQSNAKSRPLPKIAHRIDRHLIINARKWRWCHRRI